MGRPEKNEYGEWYAGYISLVPEEDILNAITLQADEIKDLAASIAENKGSYAYADGKWTVKELLGHINDGERIFAYRALRIARGDRTPLSGFEQDDYIATGRFNERTVSDLADEFVLLRRSNIKLFENLEEEAWHRMGTASDNPISVRAAAYIMTGHVRHHLNILKSRYLA
ncbi:MAG: DinB family protein [Saprospiraceae bacterium]|nr:DinB family protein [Pyrinomonadaceae bacterium]